MNLTQIIANTTVATVGQLVVERPQRGRLFESLGIDYCCAGRTSLEDACAKRGLNAAEVRARLQEFDSAGLAEEKDWSKLPLSSLIDEIVKNHHQKMREDLPRITGLLKKVINSHGARHPELSVVSQAFDVFTKDLTSHMDREESILFPWIRSFEPGSGVRAPVSLAQPIRIMMEEHSEAGESLALFSSLTGGYEPAADACATFRVLLSSLKDLQSDMHTHVHKENNILFPRALEAERSHFR